VHIYMYICVCLYVQICIDGCIRTSETPVLAAGDSDVVVVGRHVCVCVCMWHVCACVYTHA